MHLRRRAPVLGERPRRAIDEVAEPLVHAFCARTTPQDAAECEYVGTTVHRLSTLLFRGTETQLVRPRPRDPKSGEPHALRWLDGDSTWRDSTVDDAEEPSLVVPARVCVRQRERHVRNDLRHGSPWQPTVTQNGGAQCGACHLLHRDVTDSSVHPDVEQMGDPRMRQPGSTLGLGCDAFEPGSVRAVELDSLLEPVRPRPHRKECAPDLAVAERA